MSLVSIPPFFRKQRELAEQRGDYVKVLHLEADAATMCAAQYERIPIAYGLRNYEKHRDAYRQYAAHLRKLAQGKPNTLPSEINEGRHISNFTCSSFPAFSTRSRHSPSDRRVGCASQSRFNRPARRSRLSHLSRLRVDSQFLESQSREPCYCNY